MALFHLTVKVVSRAAGRSAPAAAAYRSGTKVLDRRTQRVHDYLKRRGVDHCQLVTPQGAPAWARSREQLWNQVEAREKRKNSTLAREIEVALPAELTRVQRVQLVQAFARELVEVHGVAVDLAIHTPDSKGDERNHHAHLLMTTRMLQADGFTEKTREWDDIKSGPALVTQWRERWAQMCNQELSAAGSDARVDHRSLKAQGTDREPQIHLGPTATAMTRAGKKVDLVDQVAERAAARAAAKGEAAKLREQIAALELKLAREQIATAIEGARQRASAQQLLREAAERRAAAAEIAVPQQPDFTARPARTPTALDLAQPHVQAASAAAAEAARSEALWRRLTGARSARLIAAQEAAARWQGVIQGTHAPPRSLLQRAADLAAEEQRRAAEDAQRRLGIWMDKVAAPISAARADHERAAHELEARARVMTTASRIWQEQREQALLAQQQQVTNLKEKHLARQHEHEREPAAREGAGSEPRAHDLDGPRL